MPWKEGGEFDSKETHTHTHTLGCIATNRRKIEQWIEREGEI
jgi:hypothetical protein